MSAVLEEKLARGGSEKCGMEDTRVRNRMIDGMGIVEVVGIAGSIPLLRYSCQSVSTRQVPRGSLLRAKEAH